MSWMLLIVLTLVLANLAVAVKSAREEVPVRTESDEERLSRAVADRRASEGSSAR